MTRYVRALLLSAVAIALVAGSGCGGDTKKNNEYVDSINKAQNGFVASVNKVQSSGSKKGAKQVFADLNTAIDKVVSDLKAVNPPDKVKSLHNQLVSEMSQFDDSVRKAGESLGSNDPQKILKAQTEFSTEASGIGTKISTTIDEINKKLQG